MTPEARIRRRRPSRRPLQQVPVLQWFTLAVLALVTATGHAQRQVDTVDPLGRSGPPQTGGPLHVWPPRPGPPLVAGQTVIKAVHITELRATVRALQ